MAPVLCITPVGLAAGRILPQAVRLAGREDSVEVQSALMLIVAAVAVVEEGAVEGVRDALHTMEEATRQEPGCLTYAFSLDINAPDTVRIFERWESMAALEAHFKTPHMAAFGQALGKLQPRSMEIKVYDVAGELPLPS